MTYSELDRTLELLAGADQLTEITQTRLVEHAVSRRKQALLAVLARRADLPDRLSSAVLAAGNATVVAERMRTLTISGHEEEVRQLLAREKRAVVTRGLAEMANLPENLYRELVRTDKKTTLTALLRNTSAPTEVRETAAATLLNTFGIDGVPHKLKPVLLQLGGLAARVIAPGADLRSWRFVLEHCACTSQDRARAATLLAGRLERLTDQEIRGLGGASLLFDADRITSTLVLRPLETGPAKRLAAAITTTLARCAELGTVVNQRALESLTVRVGDLGQVRGSKDIFEQIAQATSEEDLAHALLAHKGSLLTTAETLALLGSEWFGPRHWTAIHNSWQNLTDVRAAIRNPRAGAVAYLAVRAAWLGGVDELLALCDDPHAVFDDLIDVEKTWQLGLTSELLNSRYLTEAHLEKVPIGLLGYASSQKAMNFVARAIEEAAAAPETWEALLSLGQSFEGNLVELLESAGTV
jgi:hypothetical protein